MSTVIETCYGAVEGFEQDGVSKWFGIPFAKPPVGELRFRHAQEPDAWEGVRECREFGNCCWQFTRGGMDMGGTAAPMSEDCLYLNVWAPEDAPQSDEKLPVFVWIYGGAYHMGEASSPGFDLTSFARQGIIGVSFNYRLGPLGFYDYSRLSPRFDANCAVSDVIAALKWIQGNIEAFGGDPSNVTICGESAGGTMVFCAMASPEAKGLFAKAIPMSGLPGNVSTQRVQKLNGDIFLGLLGIDESQIEKLVDMTYDEMFPAADKMFSTANQINRGITFTGPVAGDSLLPKRVVEALAEGAAEGVKCLIGTCRDEGNLFLLTKEAPGNWEEVGEMLANNGLLDRMPKFREVYEADAQTEKEAVANCATDRMFWSDCVKAALAQSGHGDVYMYRFDFVPVPAEQMGLGATHTLDCNPGLDVYDPEDGGPSFYAGTPREVEEKIHGFLNGAFVNFCKTGSPEGSVGIEWPKYEPQKRATMLIDVEPSVACDPNRARFDLWEDIEIYM